jgi:hypothetical protein
MELRAKGISMRGVSEAPSFINIELNDDFVVSDLSGTSNDTDINEIFNNEAICENQSLRKEGRTKGTTLVEKPQKVISVQNALAEATSLCSHAKAESKRKNKKVRNGTFKHLISRTEIKYGFDPSTINFQTIKSRVTSNNLTGVCYQKVSH